jgi:hypothetical protein
LRQGFASKVLLKDRFVGDDAQDGDSQEPAQAGQEKTMRPLSYAISYVTPQQIERAMSEVDDPHGAQHQRKPRSQKKQQHAEDDTIYGLRYDEFHYTYPKKLG